MKVQMSLCVIIFLAFFVSNIVFTQTLESELKQIERCGTRVFGPIVLTPPHGLGKTTITGAINIPVAFHVVHDGSNGDISDTLIHDQIDWLNSAYYGTNFQFYLLSIDRTLNSNWFHNVGVGVSQPDNAASAAMKAALNRSPQYVFNIYTANPSGLLGYATFPWSYSGENDYRQESFCTIKQFPMEVTLIMRREILVYMRWGIT